jgi:hypothetical protein
MKQGIQFGERFTEQLEVIPLFASKTIVIGGTPFYVGSISAINVAFLNHRKVII